MEGYSIERKKGKALNEGDFIDLEKNQYKKKFDKDLSNNLNFSNFGFILIFFYKKEILNPFQIISMMILKNQ